MQTFILRQNGNSVQHGELPLNKLRFEHCNNCSTLFIISLLGELGTEGADWPNTLHAKEWKHWAVGLFILLLVWCRGSKIKKAARA